MLPIRGGAGRKAGLLVNSGTERQLHPSGTGVFFNFVVFKS